MNSTIFVHGSRWMVWGCLAGGLVCGEAWAAPPKNENEGVKPAAAVEDSPAKPEQKSSARRSSGGSVLGALFQLLAPRPAVTIGVDEEVSEEAEAAEGDAPLVIRAEKEVQPWKLPKATHHQTKTVKLDKKGGQGLQTFCVTPKGDLVAVVGPPRYGAATSKGKEPTSSLHVFDGEGNPLRDWDVEFVVQAVTAAPDGTIIAAGSGQVAKFTAEGELLKQQELQHVKDALVDPEKIRKGAEELLEQQREQADAMFKVQKDQLKKRIEKLNDELDEAEEDSKAAKTASRQLAAAERSLKRIEQQQEQVFGRQTVDDVIRSLTSRLKIVNAVTASQQDVFIACGVMNGYGYAVWRMTPDFEEPKQIVTGLSGCCGQMDIQCQGSELYVAENSRHRVVCYNRDGKQLRTFGKRIGQKGGEFGGCCNPMNLCFDKDGDVLTAESEGIVRKFTATGKSLGPVGGCKLTGGCKNVAIGISPDGEKVYFCDLPGSQIIVMARNTEEPAEAEAEETSATN